MEYESKDCDEKKPGGERARNTSHGGQDSMMVDNAGGSVVR